MAKALTITIGLILVLLGALLILDRLEVLEFHFWRLVGVIAGCGLILLGAWLIYHKRSSRGWQEVSAGEGRGAYALGEIRVSPTVLGQQSEYKLGLGELTVDLSRAPLAAGESGLQLAVGCGALKLILAAGSACSVEATCGIGEIEILGKSSSGLGVSLAHSDPDYAAKETRLKVSAKCGLGEIEVRRA